VAQLPTLRRARARRALGDEAPLPDLELEFLDDDEKLSTRSLVKQAIAAVSVASLGLVLAVGVSLSSSAQAEQAENSSVTAVDSRPDITRAEPATQAQGFDADTQAAIDAARGDNATTVDNSGTLDAFDAASRSTKISRSGVRAQLDSAVSAQQRDSRSSAIAQANQAAAQTAQNAARTARDEDLESDLAQVRKEAARIAADKKKAEKLLKDGEGVTSAVDVIPAEASSKGGAAPLKSGTYRLGAGWGATGSWARYHTGQDFGAPTGTPIYAVADGVVGRAQGGVGWAGNYVVLHHAGGVSTLYAHMSAKAVSPGQVVKAGQVIGYVGNTGRSFGSHLHLEYYPPGTTPGDVYSTANPLVFLARLGVRV